jgi:hypothetical protein
MRVGLPAQLRSGGVRQHAVADLAAFEAMVLSAPLASAFRLRLRSLFVRRRFSGRAAFWWRAAQWVWGLLVDACVVAGMAPAAFLGQSIVVILGAVLEVIGLQLHSRRELRQMGAVSAVRARIHRAAAATGLVSMAIGFAAVLLTMAALEDGMASASGVWSVALWILLYGLFIVWVASLLLKEWEVRPLRPGDTLALEIVTTMHQVHTSRRRWDAAAASRACCKSLDQVALTARQELAMAERTSWRSWLLRRELRDEAQRIAEVFRRHKRRIVLAGSAQDYDAVLASLLVGLQAVLEGDRQALLANAPAALALRTRLWVWFKRASLGFVLLAVGGVLRFVPLPHSVHVAAANGSLVTMGLGLAILFSANDTVYSRVGEALTRSLVTKSS